MTQLHYIGNFRPEKFGSLILDLHLKYQITPAKIR